jgi:hypothetical protein
LIRFGLMSSRFSFNLFHWFLQVFFVVRYLVVKCENLRKHESLRLPAKERHEKLWRDEDGICGLP